ncbi:MAG: rod shape-determining protein MreC [Candidatus Eremiobacteraeota bacterium]|nr:rod shape-determining protein MreC [Candidatus Eremiobacteraeota bacterium]
MGTSIAAAFEIPTAAFTTGVRSGFANVVNIPHLDRENAALQAENRQLSQENARLHETAAADAAQLALKPHLEEYPSAVQARVIGFPPENDSRSVTISAGSRAKITRDDGVLAADGVVGRVAEASPFTSKVILLTDYTSSVPAIVQRGRWWGIAKGNLADLRLEYVSQDATLKIGDKVVTGEARSFHSGALIGTIVSIEKSDSSLYQTAIVKPAVDFGSLDRLVIVAK